MGQLTSVVLPVQSLSAKAYGAKGDGVTDDRAAIQSGVTAAIAAKMPLHFPPGTYKISKYVDVPDGRKLKVTASAFATIVFPSDDTSIALDGTTTPLANPQMASRSAFLVRNSQDVTIDNLIFQGGTKQQIYDTNIGVAVYAARCQGLTLSNIVVRDGYSPLVQENNLESTGTGDSLTVSAGTVTLVDAGATFTAGHVGTWIEVSNASNPLNNGRFPVTEWVSATSIKYTNTAAVNETSSFTWLLEDGDRGTLVSGGRFYNCRGPATPGKTSRFIGCEFWRPMLADMTGRITSFAISGSVVTLVSPRAKWTKSLIGKYVAITGATSGANNGLYKITAVTPKTGTTPASLTYTNGSGVTEIAPAAARYFVQNGEKTGIGNGASALSKSGSTITLTASENAFAASDVGKSIRIVNATTVGNIGAFVILTVPAANQVTFTNASGASETFAKGWAIDSYDSVRDSGVPYGSTHGIYLFAGRSDVSVIGCSFYGIRTVGVKVSGSTTPVEGVTVADCVFQECGAAVIAGADDSQEHTQIKVHGNRMIDVGNGRPGWNDGFGIWALGARSVEVGKNSIHYTHESISAVDGRATVAGLFGIYAGRYVAGLSQPLENVDISENQITADPLNVTATNVVQAAIHVDSAGLLARYRTGGTLTKSGNVMTLTDSSAAFSQELADGCTISLVNSASGNDVTDLPIESVTGTSALTFTNAAGTGGGASAGTYRINVPTTKRGSVCRIVGNQVAHAAATAVQSVNNVAPEIWGTIGEGVEVVIEETGSLMPRIASSRIVAAISANAGVRLNSGTSWPIVYDNAMSGSGNHLGLIAMRGDVGIGVDNGTRVDYPLLGKSGKARVSQGKPELIIAFGSGHVDGDKISVNGIACTYKASSANNGLGGTFSTFAGLIALLDNATRLTNGLGASGVSAVDYGSVFATTCTTQHLLLRSVAVQTTADLWYVDTISVLNPTALVVLRNDTAGGEAIQYSRGEATGGPVHDKTVIWSPLAQFSGGVNIAPNNNGARTLLAAGFWEHVKNAKNAGCCEVVKHDDATSTGTQEFRWSIT